MAQSVLYASSTPLEYKTLFPSPAALNQSTGAPVFGSALRVHPERAEATFATTAAAVGRRAEVKPPFAWRLSGRPRVMAETVVVPDPVEAAFEAIVPGSPHSLYLRPLVARPAITTEAPTISAQSLIRSIEVALIEAAFEAGSPTASFYDPCDWQPAEPCLAIDLQPEPCFVCEIAVDIQYRVFPTPAAPIMSATPPVLQIAATVEPGAATATTALLHPWVSAYVAGLFEQVAYTGTGGATRSFTGIGFTPSVSVMKNRSVNGDWQVADRYLGNRGFIDWNGTSVQQSWVTSYDVDGFTTGGATDFHHNDTRYDYVAHAWGEAPGHFRVLVVQKAAPGDVITVEHNLGGARAYPEAGEMAESLGDVRYFDNTVKAVFALPEEQVGSYVWTNALAPNLVRLDTDANPFDGADILSVAGNEITIGAGLSSTQPIHLWIWGGDFVATGSYVGDGQTPSSAPQQFEPTPFRPRLLFVKNNQPNPRTVFADEPAMLDDVREPDNPRRRILSPARTNNEVPHGTSGNQYCGGADFTNYGFVPRYQSGGLAPYSLINQSGITHHYIAWRGRQYPVWSPPEPASMSADLVYPTLSLTPPPDLGAHDPLWSSVVLLMDYTGEVPLADQSETPHPIAVHSTAAIEGNLLQLPDRDACLVAADHPDWHIGDGDFTVELLGISFAQAGDYYYPIGQYDSDADDRAWTLRLAPGGYMQFLVSRDGDSSSTALTASWTPTLDQPYDLTVERQAGTWRLYVDGSPIDDGDVYYDVHDSTAPLAIGAINLQRDGDDGYGFVGSIAAVRITKAARYGGAHTPPTLPLPRW